MLAVLVSDGDRVTPGDFTVCRCGDRSPHRSIGLIGICRDARRCGHMSVDPISVIVADVPAAAPVSSHESSLVMFVGSATQESNVTVGGGTGVMAG
jgi:hypothetical protein